MKKTEDIYHLFFDRNHKDYSKANEHATVVNGIAHTVEYILTTSWYDIDPDYITNIKDNSKGYLSRQILYPENLNAIEVDVDIDVVHEVVKVKDVLNHCCENLSSRLEAKKKILPLLNSEDISTRLLGFQLVANLYPKAKGRIDFLCNKKVRRNKPDEYPDLINKRSRKHNKKHYR